MSFSLNTGRSLDRSDWDILVDALKVHIAVSQPSSSQSPTPGPRSTTPSIVPSADVVSSAIGHDISSNHIVASDSLRQIVTKEFCAQVASERVITTWDLAGQSQYFTSHRHFFSARALYVIVVNLQPECQPFLDNSLQKPSAEDAIDFLERRCEYWRDYVSLKAPGEKRIVVFTHADAPGLSLNDVRERVIRCRTALRGADGYYVVGLQDPGSLSPIAANVIADVRVGMDAIVTGIESEFDAITKEDRCRYPVGWILFARELLQHEKSGRLLLRWSEVQEAGLRCGIKNDEHLRRALSAITQTTAMHLLVEQPVPYLFLRCQWLADLFRAFVTKNECLAHRLIGYDDEVDRISKFGLISAHSVQLVWEQFISGLSSSPSEADLKLLGSFPATTLLHTFGILFPIGEHDFVIPGRVMKRKLGLPDIDAKKCSLDIAIALPVVPAELAGQLYASVYARRERFISPRALPEGLLFMHNRLHYFVWVDEQKKRLRISQRAPYSSNLVANDLVTVAEHFELELHSAGFRGAVARLHCAEHVDLEHPDIHACHANEKPVCPCKEPHQLADDLSSSATLFAQISFKNGLRDAIFDTIGPLGQVDARDTLDKFHARFGHSLEAARDRLLVRSGADNPDKVEDMLVHYNVCSRRLAHLFAHVFYNHLQLQ